MRRAARVDNNQKGIVKALRAIPSVTVALGHDDCLVGFKGKTYWFEIKNPSRLKKDGSLGKGAKQKGQEKLDKEWEGHYSVVTSLDEILKELKITK